METRRCWNRPGTGRAQRVARAAVSGAGVRILLEDAWLLAVDKPPGLLVHRTEQARGERDVVLQRLRDQIGQFVYPVHRLDRPTSGVLIFGLSGEAAGALHEALTAESAKKEYLALARGFPGEGWTCARPLTGRPARTTFRHLAQWGRSAFLHARLHSGRRHQVRRHLHHIAHQILGDTQYGKGRINRFLRETYGMPRLCLHAWRLSLEHPEGGRLELEAPFPADLEAFFLRLPEVEAKDLQAALELAASPAPWAEV